MIDEDNTRPRHRVIIRLSQHGQKMAALAGEPGDREQTYTLSDDDETHKIDVEPGDAPHVAEGLSALRRARLLERMIAIPFSSVNEVGAVTVDMPELVAWRYTERSTPNTPEIVDARYGYEERYTHNTNLHLRPRTIEEAIAALEEIVEDLRVAAQKWLRSI